MPICLAMLAAPLSAQLGLPQVELPAPGTVLDPVTGEVLDRLGEASDGLTRQALRLADLRARRLEQLVRRNRDLLEMDINGEPARRGELLLIDATADLLGKVQQFGFTVRGTEAIDALGLAVSRVIVPQGMTLAEAQLLLDETLPSAEVAANNLHFPGGTAPAPAIMLRASMRAGINTPVGVIDGGAGELLPASAQHGFANGAPYPSDHGSSVVSLLRYAGVRNLRLADVYGSGNAGGNALAIAQALGWLAQGGSKVINISLVGPDNALVSRAVSRARAAGIEIVAAVGNDGPASPPTYPASYEGVLAVTAVDKRNRPLIESGRALHLDYAAPGADIYGRNAAGKMTRLRGTSFAAPLVTARLAAALEHAGSWRSRLDNEARDLGKKGPDAQFGRGLLCETCRPQK